MLSSQRFGRDGTGAEHTAHDWTGGLRFAPCGVSGPRGALRSLTFVLSYAASCPLQASCSTAHPLSLTLLLVRLPPCKLYVSVSLATCGGLTTVSLRRGVGLACPVGLGAGGGGKFTAPGPRRSARAAPRPPLLFLKRTALRLLWLWPECALLLSDSNSELSRSRLSVSRLSYVKFSIIL